MIINLFLVASKRNLPGTIHTLGLPGKHQPEIRTTSVENTMLSWSVNKVGAKPPASYSDQPSQSSYK